MLTIIFSCTKQQKMQKIFYAQTNSSINGKFENKICKNIISLMILQICNALKN
jgi:hypothetical protein